MAGQVSSGDDEMITAINVTPLVDIVLVLLVILMVTASYVSSLAIPMELPRGATGEVIPTTLAVAIDSGGNLYLDGDEIDEAGLAQKIRAAHAKDADTRATISADGSVPHRRMVQVIDLLRREEVVKFAINIDPAELVRGGSP